MNYNSVIKINCCLTKNNSSRNSWQENGITGKKME